MCAHVRSWHGIGLKAIGTTRNFDVWVGVFL